MKNTIRKKRKQAPPSLQGQFLIAMPNMPDKRFARSVIYMFEHSPQSAMGLILNQRADHISFQGLLEHLKLFEGKKSGAMPARIQHMDVHVGGPVDAGRGFVLHSADYRNKDATLVVDDEISMTATVDILRALARGQGPDRALLALGYAGWGAGQLENEMASNGWLHCTANADVIFDRDVDTKYERALAILGIQQTHLSSVAGHA
ncbi:MAG: YqgE/AlgH family protein [Hyphomicrobiaceae bacterium]